MKVRVLGDSLLAITTREACILAGHDDTDIPEVLWVCIDTPVVDDEPNVDYVCDQIAAALEHLPTDVLVLVSSQVPVGTCARLETQHPGYTFAVSPENVRRATAAADFMSQDRIVIGARHHEPRLEELLKPFCDRLLWMSPESAEMVKHALNAYLAMCIAFANEIADVCATVGADVGDVHLGFTSDGRVSDSAPLRPGGPYTGGTLGRDVRVLTGLTDGPLVHGIRASNTRRL